jgi:broad specificity phosphatase PhoE
VTILLVRHARAGRRDRWEGDDRLRPLSGKGRAQAGAIPGVVEPWTAAGTALLVSSPWIRCVETLDPLAAALGGGIVVDETLGEGMGAKAVEALGSWMRSWPAVLCTHGDVIEEVLSTLMSCGVDLGREPHAAKGSVWVLDGGAGDIRTARYLPAPS